MKSNEVLRYLTATLDVFCMTSRRTGRTSAMLDAAQAGDCIIVASESERRRLQQKLAVTHRAKEIDVVVASPHRLHPLHPTLRNYRRVLFDHYWLEQYYQASLVSATVNLELFILDHIREQSPNLLDPPPREASFELSRMKLTLRKNPQEKS